MKKIMGILFIVLIHTGCTTGQGGINNDGTPKVPLGPEGFSIVGKWISEDTSQADQYIIFKDTGYVTMGSSQIEFKGPFKINYNKTPFELDMTLTDVGKIRTIFRIIDNNKIEVAGTEPEIQRPKDFNKDSEVLVRTE